jgi:mono/diheme cytochrome c family protein
MSITLRLLTFALLFVATILFATSLRIESRSSAQNANSSTTNKNQNQNDTRSIAPAPKAQQDFSQNTWELPEDADKTPNPVPSSAESIAKGKELYFERTKGNCVFCHGDTGSGNEANLPRLRRKPADLSNKERMTAMTDGELFWKITKGINGIMPAGENRMKEAEERWHVVNYIRTLAKDKQ